MAAIVDSTYYTGTYRAGSTAVIGATEFPFYSKKAEKELGRQTFGRLSTATVTDDIKDCICEIAEFLYKLEKATTTGMIQTAFSNDGQSGSFEASALLDKSGSVRSIVKSYLSGTDLLKAGVDLCP